MADFVQGRLFYFRFILLPWVHSGTPWYTTVQTLERIRDQAHVQTWQNVTQHITDTRARAFKKKGGTAADQSERKKEKWYLMF